jgi:hypothetical protein
VRKEFELVQNEATSPIQVLINFVKMLVPLLSSNGASKVV